MNYPGGKNQCFRKLVNLIPPHRVYVETHAGSAAIARRKLPAMETILVEIDSYVCDQLASVLAEDGDSAAGGIDGNGDKAQQVASSQMTIPAEQIPLPGVKFSPGCIAKNGDTAASLANVKIINGDALQFLQGYDWQGDEFIYADPPYVGSSRSSRTRLYRFEYVDRDHERLLTYLKTLPCNIMISGYWSDLYADILHDWYTYQFEAMTRGGSMAQEWIWMNYSTPIELHDYRFLGDNFRERERIKRKKARWIRKIKGMGILERRALLSALQEADVNVLEEMDQASY